MFLTAYLTQFVQKIFCGSQKTSQVEHSQSNHVNNDNDAQVSQQINSSTPSEENTENEEHSQSNHVNNDNDAQVSRKRDSSTLSEEKGDEEHSNGCKRQKCQNDEQAEPTQSSDASNDASNENHAQGSRKRDSSELSEEKSDDEEQPSSSKRQKCKSSQQNGKKPLRIPTIRQVLEARRQATEEQRQQEQKGLDRLKELHHIGTLAAAKLNAERRTEMPIHQQLFLHKFLQTSHNLYYQEPCLLCLKPITSDTHESDIRIYHACEHRFHLSCLNNRHLSIYDFVMGFNECIFCRRR